MKEIILCLVAWVYMSQGFAQSITGTVSNAKGEPLAGAHIVVEGKFLHAYSDYNGRYELAKAGEKQVTLTASFIGYEKVSRVLLPRDTDRTLNFELAPKAILTPELSIVAIRAPQNSPTTQTNISKEELEKQNLGQDMPYMLELTPSVVVTSDAGAGVGYTGMRVRGIDATRVNITLNGIPLNDGESQGTFWVDLPDFASSTENIQIQRGVGTSTNGTGAFGASVNLQTTGLRMEPYLELNNSQGSFSTFKNNVVFGTGLLSNAFTLDGRLSRIVSEGYVDRSAANLKSFYISVGHHAKTSTTRLNVFTGHEITQQAWYGTPSAKLTNDAQGIYDYIIYNGLSAQQAQNLTSSDRRYNHYLYDREVDDYNQSHYQLINELRASDVLSFQTALHLTRGAGYFEQFQDKNAPADQTDLAFYNIAPVLVGDDTILQSDLIRQRWLQNDFYGLTYAAKYTGIDRLQLILGGAWNRYLGNHFGQVVWAEFAGNSAIRDEYYRNSAEKKDFNAYLKADYSLGEDLNLFGDVQVRTVSYSFFGPDIVGTMLQQTVDINFFNPKMGLTYMLNPHNQLYASAAFAGKEPNRSDFTESTAASRPLPEKLIDYEFGFRTNSNKAKLQATAYFMDYTNQLVLTGQLNDVGANTRVNIPDSYRAGLELEWAIQVFEKLRWNANTTISTSKIKSFSEYVDNWDTGGQDLIQHTNSNIAFSPNLVGSSDWTWTIFSKDTAGGKSGKQMDLTLLSKCVGRQFVDNTQSLDRSIDPYFLNDIRLQYTVRTKLFKEVNISLLVRNLFNAQYESNAWVYRYKLGGEFGKLDGYFPQAGTFYLVGLTLKL